MMRSCSYSRQYIVHRTHAHHVCVRARTHAHTHTMTSHPHIHTKACNLKADNSTVILLLALGRTEPTATRDTSKYSRCSNFCQMCFS